MICPSCNIELDSVRFEHIAIYACKRCKGKAATLNSFERRLRKDLRDRIRHWAPQYGIERQRRCPSCRSWMATIPIRFQQASSASPPTVIDLCKGCRIFWFDKDELEHFPVDLDYLNEDPNRPILDLQVDEVNSFHNFLADSIIEGLPILKAEKKNKSLPVVAIILGGIAIAMAIMTRGNSPLFDRWKFIPDQAFRQHGLSLLTHLFLHLDKWHLFGNLFFFGMFASLLEELKGSDTLLWVFALSGISGALMHGYFDPHPEIALVGMSGAISGVMAFISLSLPKARISYRYCLRPFTSLLGFSGLLFPRAFLQAASNPFQQYRATFSLPVWLWSGFWIFYQIASAQVQITGSTQTSYLAHIGGALGGLLASLIF